VDVVLDEGAIDGSATPGTLARPLRPVSIAFDCWRLLRPQRIDLSDEPARYRKGGRGRIRGSSDWLDLDGGNAPAPDGHDLDATQTERRVVHQTFKDVGLVHHLGVTYGRHGKKQQLECFYW
jgi:hypothetical protein